MSSWRDKSKEFLEKAHLYDLGHLVTESSHPQTQKLSHWSKENLPKAISTLREIDLGVLDRVIELLPQVHELKESIEQTMKRGDRIFLCGCGATGRLSLTLEYLWREQFPASEQVIAFMAGGDVALVHSLEGFEDFPEYGALQLEQLGFSQGDLLISSTEGGETPFVIGATEKAAELSSESPFFLFCNPKKQLHKNVERSRRVFENQKIRSQEYFVGPMALAGSTRMQASTVLELAIGLALLSGVSSDLQGPLEQFRNYFSCLDLGPLKNFVEEESRIYQDGDYLIYKAMDYGITVFTDTTERAPTFSLLPFAPLGREGRNKSSLCYVALPSSNTSEESWRELLNRDHRSLNWSEVDTQTMDEYLESFNFAGAIEQKRQNELGSSKQWPFLIQKNVDGIEWSLNHLNWTIPLSQMSSLYEHVLVKLLLNIHSTLVMGRLERYRSNFMTWVNPTNGKLINRSMRYIKLLLEIDYGVKEEDKIIVEELFRQLETLKPGKSIVLTTLRALGPSHP